MNWRRAFWGLAMASDPRNGKKQSKLLAPRPIMGSIFPSEFPSLDNDKPQPPVARWRNAVLGPDGPKSPQTRSVLLTLAHHMNEYGFCYPSQDLLVLESGLSKRTVIRHLAVSEAEGWIRRTEEAGFGKGHRRHEYQAMVPLFDGDGDRVAPRQSWRDHRRRMMVSQSPVMVSQSPEKVTEWHPNRKRIAKELSGLQGVTNASSYYLPTGTGKSDDGHDQDLLEVSHG